jgi:aryl-alcohol dehydrogenase-like predicted oxidoreductase
MAPARSSSAPDVMKRRTLGRTGLLVSELELGVCYIDTAPGYADSEQVLGVALEGIEKPLMISTKLSGRPIPFEPRDKAALVRSAHESLRLLKREQIDILMIHELDRPGQHDWWPDDESFTGPSPRCWRS